MPGPHDPSQNHLLAVLPADVIERIIPRLELVPMPLGHVVYESGSRMSYVYFPTTCIVSLLNELSDGALAEIASWAATYGGRQRDA